MSNAYRGTIKVRFADTDANGHAFFGNYFVFADEVLGDYWAELGWDVSDVVNQDYLTFTVNAMTPNALIQPTIDSFRSSPQ